MPTNAQKAEMQAKIDKMLGAVPGMVDGEIVDLAAVFAHYRDIKVEFAWPSMRMASLEKKMREHIRDTGEVADIDGAKITFRRGFEKEGIDEEAILAAAANDGELAAAIEDYETKWIDGEALLAAAEDDEDLRALIEDYVKVTKRAPGISFKVD